MTERLQKIISAAGLMSRRAAEDCVSKGRVSVNGAVSKLGDKADPETDLILLDGKPLPSPDAKVYIMLNKPRGYVTTANDEKGRKNVTELVSDLGVRVYPVGRLDMFSEGLLIMTNDGDFANFLMHPSHNVKKTYNTWVSGDDLLRSVEKLRQPVELDGYMIRTPAVALLKQYEGGALLAVTISEGRNRQVRKMCELAGLRVERLCRVSEGALELGNLPAGQWRRLTQRELELVRK